MTEKESKSEIEREHAEHKKAMQDTQKTVRDAVAGAKVERGVIVYLYGEGKGKSSSGFGTLLRALGHGQHCAIVQFIKGAWKTGEEIFFKEAGHTFSTVRHSIMGTGFTWDTQDKAKDIAAAKKVWLEAEQYLADNDINFVLLDELTYMFDFGYLDLDHCLKALRARPKNQNVFITGRSRIPELCDIADTVSEVREIKHAFNAGVRAQKGIEF